MILLSSLDTSPCFMARGNKWVEPNVIGLGCAVLLKSGPVEQMVADSGRWRGNSPRAPRINSQQRFGSSAYWGDLLEKLSKYVQDIEELSYDIVAVQSNYLRAYQETCEEFSTRFPGE